MRQKKKSSRVPQAIRPKYDAIIALIDPICDQYLNAEYKQYAHYLTAALARKRPSPIERSQPKSWAAGVVHALGTVNFLFDSSFEPHLKASQLYRLFNVSEATGQGKSKQIRDLFDMYQFDENWTLPSRMDQNPYVWMLDMDGYIVDARNLPVEFQMMLVEEGIIPYVPGGEMPSEPEPAQQRRKGVPADARCGVCGKQDNLTKTSCCDNWICDDTDQYVMFSYARNSCYRNHDRYTLCAYHWHEGHDGDWQTCAKCRAEIEPEMYAYYGTNEYNFTVLKNPPKFKPTRCAECKRVISLSQDGYMLKPNGDYICTNCSPPPQF
jgi:hypothetical protein